MQKMQWQCPTTCSYNLHSFEQYHGQHLVKAKLYFENYTSDSENQLKKSCVSPLGTLMMAVNCVVTLMRVSHLSLTMQNEYLTSSWNLTK